MSWRPDPEIDELFPEPGDRRLAHSLRSVHAPEVSADPAFRSQLRRQLMQEAWQGAEPRLSWWRRLWSPQRVAWAMAAVGALLIAVVVYSTSTGGGDRTVLIRTNVDATRPVAAVQPLELTFSQPMNRQSVESALQIQPATAVQYQWTSDSQVKIIPTSGAFAPNTQYSVSLKQNVAQTQLGHAVPAATPVIFTVAPTPPPAPRPSPSATPTPALNATVLGAAADIRPQWNYQNKIAAVSPTGALQLFGIDGGSPQVLVPSGVTAFALGPGAEQGAYVQDGRVMSLATNASAVSPAGASAIAVGFGSRTIAYATATSLADTQGHSVKLEASATAAWISPGADRAVYAAADHSLHLVDMAAGKETAWPAGALSFLAWAPDGAHALYAAADGVYASDPAGQSPVRVAPLSQVTAADWPASGPLLVEAGGLLHQLAPDGTADRVLGSAAATALAASPQGAIALVGGGHLAFAQPGLGAGAGLTVDAAAPVVGAFEKARLSGDQAGAAEVVATTARTIAPPATGIQRWFTVAALPGPDGIHETVRVVLADKTGRDTLQLDETLLVVAGPAGKPVVASAVDSAPRPYGGGPEVLSVSLTGSGIAVEFDSDLTAASVPAGLRLVDASGKPVATTPAVTGRTVTLAPAAPLAAGTYRLSVGALLLDANRRPAATTFELDVPITA